MRVNVHVRGCIGGYIYIGEVISIVSVLISNGLVVLCPSVLMECSLLCTTCTCGSSYILILNRFYKLYYCSTSNIL